MSRAGTVLALVLTTAAALAAAAPARSFTGGGRWTAEERETLRSLSLAALGPLPPDPSNRVADDTAAAALGHRLFFDPRLSGNGRVSCALCHVPGRVFQDGAPLSAGVGTTTRRTQPIAGTAYTPWQFWDGRADSQWAQALGPLESAVEHGTTRTQVVLAVAEHHRRAYVAAFGPLPDLDGLPERAGPVPNPTWRAEWGRIPAARQEEVTRVYVNVGKAIAAYERRIGYAPTRFDRYVEAELAGRPHTAASAFSADEEAGLRTFVGKGRCVTCHVGPRLTDDGFHNTGVPPSPDVPAPDSGRATGARDVLAAEFNCRSRWSDVRPEECAALRGTVAGGEALVRAFKTPSLRGVPHRAPYMHAGQLARLEDVVAHYDRAPAAPAGRSELRPLGLSAAERRQLVAFLRTLRGPVSAPPAFLAFPSLEP
ncbi:cytochrome c peroxidase [Roseisolibacter sp. H3M3-2]|uniref:cytochrome-c peroxidase n=1 Tax=Roseisolibacter sp. H3M3-2 TaxID=3031323 RepID=UPI0023DAB1CB|nr:cytochrome c peroxidase [Roseisolibacter sp. H3M3-2]MDF1501403.1 cytochrome c peroxidase [Roseisolibacter sp. H3M3-2]